MTQKRKLIFLLILLIIVLFLLTVSQEQVNLLVEKIFIQLYGEPISEDGTINNNFFGINNEGKEAEKTTKGINNAIEYANKHNIEYLKLNKGVYLINGTGKYYEKKGIALKSNMTLDLNGATIKEETTSDIRYSIITIFEVENVKLINGIIEGDKDTHDYDSIISTHEWGYGIELRGAKNIEISNLIIKNLIGDGILISEMEGVFSDNNQDNISEKIYINNCNIFDNRRQGISIIDAENVYIYNNEIHHIEGTNPQAAIDIEPNLKTEYVDKVYIYNNKFYELGNIYAIKTEGGTYNVDIYKNDIYGGFLIASAEDKIKIYNNVVKDGKIDITLTNYNSSRGYNLNKIQIQDNNINNININMNLAENILLENNEIFESNININDCLNVAILNNTFKNNGNRQFDYSYSEQKQDYLNLYLYGNKEFEQYNTEINFSGKLHIITDLNQINQYKLKNFN